MNSSVLILCIIHSLFISGIVAINVKIFDDSVHSDGEEIHLITDEEADKFGLKTMENWAPGLRIGGRELITPRGVYFKDPTPWGDRFQMEGKTPVRTTTRLLKGTILERTTTPEVVATQDCINRRINETVTCTFALTATRTNSIATGWTQEIGLSMTAGISIGFKGLFGASAEMQVSTAFGNSTTHQVAVELGTELGSETLVAPQKAITANLISEKGRMRVQLTYAMTYSGTALVYAFWAVPRDVMRASRLYFGTDCRKAPCPDVIKTTQVVDISVYSKATIVIHDKS